MKKASQNTRYAKNPLLVPHTQKGRTKTAHVYVNLMAQSFCWLLFWMTFWVEIGDQHLEFVA